MQHAFGPNTRGNMLEHLEILAVLVSSRKSITTGEGGMITTDDKSLAEKIRMLRDHGAAMTDLQRHLETARVFGRSSRSRL